MEELARGGGEEAVDHFSRPKEVNDKGEETL